MIKILWNKQAKIIDDWATKQAVPYKPPVPIFKDHDPDAWYLRSPTTEQANKQLHWFFVIMSIIVICCFLVGCGSLQKKCDSDPISFLTNSSCH